MGRCSLDSLAFARASVDANSPGQVQNVESLCDIMHSGSKKPPGQSTNAQKRERGKREREK